MPTSEMRDEQLFKRRVVSVACFEATGVAVPLEVANSTELASKSAKFESTDESSTTNRTT